MPRRNSNNGRRLSFRRSSSHNKAHQTQNSKTSSSSGKKKGKKTKGPMVDKIIKQAGRWFSRAADPFINVKNAIVVGMKLKDICDNDQDDNDEDSRDNNQEGHDEEPTEDDRDGNGGEDLNASENPGIDMDLWSQQCYDKFSSSKDQDFVIGCETLVKYGKDLPALNKLLKAMQAASNSARSDDTGKVLPDTLKLLKRDRNHQFKKPEPVHKSKFGFNHEDTARFLVPVDDIKMFDDNPAVYMEAVQSGEIRNEWWCLPLFLFDEELLQNDDPTGGLFRGYVLVRFFCHIFLGSGLPERQGKTNGRDTVATRHGMTSVTSHHVAYAATQARYCLGTVDKWQQFDGGFDLWRFFWSIIDFFEGPDKNDAAENILAWWNKEVFSTRNTVKRKEEKSSAPPATSCYAIMQEQRRQAKKARQEVQEPEPPQVQQYTSDNGAQNSPPRSQSESSQHSNTPHHHSQSQSPRRSNAPHHCDSQSQVPRSPKYHGLNHDASDEDDNALEDFNTLSYGAHPRHSSSQYRPTASHNSRWQPLDSSTPSAPLQRLHRHQGSPSSSREHPREASSACQSKNKRRQHLEFDGNHQPSNSLKKQKTRK
ncbi:hypothetical protein IW261DRAFT_1509111 [Armillaria novae-zelandiae]|uniref:Uncharacterized protein n=1 Tax=Armillaria novae-zelandiae TaxID=153914 RepID=A0AA39NUX0_9AGAR|nr:hypothetical protein IW261DRAFT_1509111 [Armillaria novae-zelandiae]